LSYARTSDRSVRRGGGIRTPGLLLPKQVRCQAALLPGFSEGQRSAGRLPASYDSVVRVGYPYETGRHMKSAVEALEGHKVKVSVEVDAGEFETAVDAAFRKIAREVRIPGFRPGKAPRRILEARLGKEAGRETALRDALPEYYAQALREHEVEAIAPPEIDITEGRDGGDIVFDAIVEVRPHLDLSGYGGLKVTIPNPAVSDDDVSARIDRLRANFGELTPVGRPARAGDHLVLGLSATRGGEPVPSLTIDDYSYELGSGDVLPELDEQLPGAKPGDILAFDADHPDGRVSLRVLVKEVREKVLPEVTDEWAADASEFDTVAELKADIARQLALTKRAMASIALQNGAIDAVVDLVDEDPPEAMVNAEVERQVHDLGHRLEAQRATLAQYLEATGQSEQQLVADLRAAAVPAVKADLALRAVAEAEGLEPDDEEIDDYLGKVAPRYGVDAAQLRAQLERADQMLAVRSDLRKSKALDWLVEHAEVVDEAGQPIDRALLEEPQEQEEDGPTTEDPTEAEKRD
jgi:trigger factor